MGAFKAGRRLQLRLGMRCAGANAQEGGRLGCGCTEHDWTQEKQPRRRAKQAEVRLFRLALMHEIVVTCMQLDVFTSVSSFRGHIDDQALWCHLDEVECNSGHRIGVFGRVF